MDNHLIDYLRVLPRDLFNEAKLFKCLGRVVLLIEDNMAPTNLSYAFDGCPFQVFLLKEGSLTVTNLLFYLSEEGITLKTIYNSKANYPLLCQYRNEEVEVFDESGNFTKEFLSLCSKA